MSQEEELKKPLLIIDSNNNKIDEKTFSDDKFVHADSNIAALVKGKLIALNNKSNLITLHYADWDSMLPKAKTPYFLTTVTVDSNESYEPYLEDDVWYYYNFKDWFKQQKDSIYLDRKAGIIDEALSKIQKLDSIKYVLVLSDRIIKKPAIVSRGIFETGILISVIKLYEISTRKLLCYDVIFTTNSDKVRDIGFDAGTSDMYKAVWNMRLMEDFCGRRNQSVEDYFSNRNKK
ncbi:hypothetical protein [Ferruginibacter albus]|uniref:hypothetical protein n=1 Tax=Ferruginibacter albus TaxID=2875540 RepID=UPI001CC7F10E|nr:hypothetical protein [Ferruginibacter albus]UAY53582.1 hypothetical protein K9M53_07925 [Ferruginibacter albus]